ncbi:MAG TPA: VWA domain-containing protein [Planctomycetota bacterium]|nr:VWA domain-containing protein [Planctomycetota bacterium]
MSFLRFADPIWFLLLLPLLAVLLVRRQDKNRPAVIFSSLRNLKKLPITKSQRLRRLLPAMFALGCLGLILALARPQSGREETSVRTDGVAIQLVVDRSGSMGKDDLDQDRFDRQVVTRLDVVKDVLVDFVEPGGDLPGRPGDLLGLVTFAGYVQAHAPLTLDHAALSRALKTVQIPPMTHRNDDVQSTAIGDGLVLALNRLREVEAKSKVIVLLSDGENTAGTSKPADGARLAKSDGVKVYTVGIGAGREMDEEALQEIATLTGGRYFRARSADGIRGVYAAIDDLERSEITSLSATRWTDHFQWPLGAGILLLFLYSLLMDTRFRSLP